MSARHFTPSCDECGAAIPEGMEHLFESTRGKKIGTYCDSCCPRCWQGRREIPVEEHA